jgi:hypothetical protein
MDVVGEVGRKMQKQTYKAGGRGGSSVSVDIRTTFFLEPYPLAKIRNPHHPPYDPGIDPAF